GAWGCQPALFSCFDVGGVYRIIVPNPRPWESTACSISIQIPYRGHRAHVCTFPVDNRNLEDLLFGMSRPRPGPMLRKRRRRKYY
ncbi:hypothetical protein V2G26_002987, partial [Clonostachys chloroleuca]